MKLSFLAICLLFSPSILARDVCNRSSTEITNFLYESSSRISFRNAGGIFNKGVCWWHSRLQRSSAYLTQFEPVKNKPSSTEVRKILLSLRSMSGVVIIPGYENFHDFSRDHQAAIQKLLNEWQKIDGIFHFVWTNSVTGNYWLSATKMKNQMDKIYSYYLSSPAPIWLMAQIKGLAAHSVLVLKMNKVAGGYDLEVIDSNHPLLTLSVNYRYGDNQIQSLGFGAAYVPYLGFQNDFKMIARALKKDCGNSSMIQDMESVPTGIIER